MSNNKKNRCLRATDEDWQIIKNAAAEKKLSIIQFMVNVASEKKNTANQNTDFEELINQLHLIRTAVRFLAIQQEKKLRRAGQDDEYEEIMEQAKSFQKDIDPKT